MEKRRLLVGSLVEWGAAGLGVLVLGWIVSGPIQRAVGPHVEAAIASDASALPPGVPPGAVNIPLVLLLDGREIRIGDLHAHLDETLPPQLADGPAFESRTPFGDRHTRRYVVSGARFYVVCERSESGGPLRVSGIYLP